MTRTPHFDLNEIDAQSSLSDDGWKYGTTDRETIDRKLHQAATHRHTGSVTVVDAPSVAPNLQLSVTPGNLLPNTRYYYKYTYIDGTGEESLPSSEAFIDTPDQVVSPDAPIVATAGLGGVLASGDYYYVLSAYAPDATRETQAANPTMVTAAAGSTNKNTVTLPDLPVGADGFNLYRMVPSGIGYFLLATIDMSGMSPPTEYEDDGSVAANAERTLPLSNTTNSYWSVTVCLPGATPVVPPGMVWRIYRTAVALNYAVSRLRTIDDESTCYLDQGLAASTGAPPTQSGTDAPEPIDLTDGAEVQGTLPPASVVFKETIQFRRAGTLTVLPTGNETWRCPYERAVILHVQISLGRLSSASGADVIVDVNKYTGSAATPAWGTIFSTQANRPRVLVGNRRSIEAIPDILTLFEGDELSFDIDQVGGAATPTDADLLVQIVIWHADSTASSIGL